MSIRIRAPGRVNLIGDHTDYTGGLVFPIAINRWTEIRGERSQRITLISEDEFGAVELATQPAPPRKPHPLGVDMSPQFAMNSHTDRTLTAFLEPSLQRCRSVPVFHRARRSWLLSRSPLASTAALSNSPNCASRRSCRHWRTDRHHGPTLHRKRDTRPRNAHRLQRPHDRSCRSTRRRKDRSSIYCTSNTPRLGVFGKGQRMLTSRGRDRSASSRQSFRHRRDH